MKDTQLRELESSRGKKANVKIQLDSATHRETHVKICYKIKKTGEKKGKGEESQK